MHTLISVLVIMASIMRSLALPFLVSVGFLVYNTKSFHLSPTKSRLLLGTTVPAALRPHQLNLMDKAKGDDELTKVFDEVSPVLQNTSRLLRRVSWISWWSQVILTTVSTVILTFARRAGNRSNWLLSGLGVTVSGLSIFWTWGNGARLSRRLIRRPVPNFKAAVMLRRAIRVGVTLNLVGLLVHLWSAQEIVGSLALKVLTTPAIARTAVMYGGNAGSPEGYLEPLDVLVVQANTNSLLSHFCSMVCLLYMTRKLALLDPPSTSEIQRSKSE